VKALMPNNNHFRQLSNTLTELADRLEQRETKRTQQLESLTTQLPTSTNNQLVNQQLANQQESFNTLVTTLVTLSEKWTQLPESIETLNERLDRQDQELELMSDTLTTLAKALQTKPSE
jgi:chromosome segregation ATPase